jgi:hypothetical protein
MSATTAAIVKIPLLTNRNWPTWKVQMKMHLIRESLWGYVDGTEAWPTAQDKENITKKEQEALKVWKDKAEKAVATIFPFLDPTAQQLLGDLMDPSALWEKIKKLYEVHGFSATFVIWKRLLGAKADKGPLEYAAKI